MNRAFKVIQGHPGAGSNPERCVVVICAINADVISETYEDMGIWQRENGKFVDFNDPTQVARN